MAFIPQPFGTTTPEALANYNYQDIASATGITNFYGTAASNSIVASYSLVENAVYSYPPGTMNQVADNSGVLTLTVDKDFDLVFNRSIIIKGDAVISVPHSIIGGSATKTSQIQCYVSKWDGTTETVLCQGSGANLVSTTTALAERVSPIKVTIPQTKFKRGDTLRLTVQGWYANGGGGTAASFALFHDPKGQTIPEMSSAISTILTFPVPQRIDI